MNRVEPAPAASTTSRFTAVPQEELGRIESASPDDEGRYAWLRWAAVAVALAALVGFAWYATRPPSADRLYATIDRLVEQSDAAAAADEIASFLERFPDDPRRAELEEYQQDIEVARLERIMERRVRAARVGEGMSLVETTYLAAMQTAQADPVRAARQLQSLVEVFGTAPDQDAETRACVELASKQRERLQEAIRRNSEEHRSELETRLAAARALTEKDPQAARAIWSGIVELYAGQEWAETAVEQAGEHLAQAPSKPSTATRKVAE
jgi:hypothetical protein